MAGRIRGEGHDLEIAKLQSRLKELDVDASIEGDTKDDRDESLKRSRGLLQEKKEELIALERELKAKLQQTHDSSIQEELQRERNLQANLQKEIARQTDMESEVMKHLDHKIKSQKSVILPFYFFVCGMESLR